MGKKKKQEKQKKQKEKLKKQDRLKKSEKQEKPEKQTKPEEKEKQAKQEAQEKQTKQTKKEKQPVMERQVKQPVGEKQEKGRKQKAGGGKPAAAESAASKTGSQKSFDAAELFRALGDANRLRILALLRETETCAGDLLKSLSIVQSTLSHHMKILVDSGIVKCRRQGKWSYYSVDREMMEKIDSLMECLTPGKQAEGHR